MVGADAQHIAEAVKTLQEALCERLTVLVQAVDANTEALKEIGRSPKLR